MAYSREPWQLALAVLLLTIASMVDGQSVPMAYCASINTATTSANASTFQSDGLCYDWCIDDYAFAIVQDANCWCSDYAPDTADRADTDDCDTSCPGYPSDTCGGGSTLWGYMSGTVYPSGTSGIATSTAAATTTADDTTTSPTSTKKTKATSTDTAKTTENTSPTVSMHTTTANGHVSVMTVTMAPSATGSAAADASASLQDGQSSNQGLTTGQAVGIAVGVLAFVILIGALAVYLWLRRKRNGQEELEQREGGRGSSAGMMTPRTDMASVWDGDASTTGRRGSRFMPHDPRLDPAAVNIYTRFDNKSQESLNTLRDDFDYSRRVLRTTNPDPTD